MENRRGGQKGDNFVQEVSKRRSRSNKPPRGSWQPTVPSWEKTFCKVVGLLDWDTILEMKKFAHLFDNVVTWNDSAGEEAFQNAKNRFWAETNGIPCDVTLPDPNLYIDEIDWDSKIDPELLSDLECRNMVPDADDNHEPVVIFGDSLYADQSFTAAGWGDEDDNLRNATQAPCNKHDSALESGWDTNNGTVKEDGWEASEDKQWCSNERVESTGDTGWDSGWNRNVSDYKVVESENLWNRYVTDSDRGWGTWYLDDRKKDNRFVSRYRTSRYHHDDHFGSANVGRYRKGQKMIANNAWEPLYAGRRIPANGWSINLCGPVNRREPRTAGTPLRWENRVS